MLGLVSEWRLKEAEQRIVKLRLKLHRANIARQEAEKNLAVECKLREAAEAERDRLMTIIQGQPGEPAAENEAKPAAPEAPPIPRMLTGIEVVQRATLHRNVRHKA